MYTYTMNKKYIIGIIFPLIIISLFFLFKKDAKITNFPSNRTEIVMFGDSLVAGNGSTEGNDLPSQLSRRIISPIINLGVPGNTTIDGMNRLNEIPTNARLVIVNLGGNDALKRVPKETTLSNIQKIVNHIHSNGSMAMIISVRNGLIVGNFDDEYSKIAKETGSLFMPNLLKGLFGDPEFMADPIHPNDKGYSIIAQKIEEVIEDYI